MERAVATGEVRELESVEPGTEWVSGVRSRDGVGDAPLSGNKFPNA